MGDVQGFLRAMLCSGDPASLSSLTRRAGGRLMCILCGPYLSGGARTELLFINGSWSAQFYFGSVLAREAGGVHWSVKKVTAVITSPPAASSACKLRVNKTATAQGGGRGGEGAGIFV